MCDQIKKIFFMLLAGFEHKDSNLNTRKYIIIFDKYFKISRLRRSRQVKATNHGSQLRNWLGT